MRQVDPVDAKLHLTPAVKDSLFQSHCLLTDTERELF